MSAGLGGMPPRSGPYFKGGGPPRFDYDVVGEVDTKKAVITSPIKKDGMVSGKALLNRAIARIKSLAESGSGGIPPQMPEDGSFLDDTAISGPPDFTGGMKDHEDPSEYSEGPGNPYQMAGMQGPNGPVPGNMPWQGNNQEALQIAPGLRRPPPNTQWPRQPELPGFGGGNVPQPGGSGAPDNSYQQGPGFPGSSGPISGNAPPWHPSQMSSMRGSDYGQFDQDMPTLPGAESGFGSMPSLKYDWRGNAVQNPSMRGPAPPGFDAGNGNGFYSPNSQQNPSQMPGMQGSLGPNPYGYGPSASMGAMPMGQNYPSQVDPNY